MTKDLMWAGTESSLAQYTEQVKNVTSMNASTYGDDYATESLLSVQGNVGVVSIRGPLTNKDSWLNAFTGAVSYNQISDALIEAAELPSVHSVLLDIDSPGGAVSGVLDVAELIRYVDTSIKPVYSYSSGSMCSGAYWLGSSAREIYASRVATIGSIGVITTSMDYSKQLEDDGVKATVIRAGKYKQMGNPYEPLSDTGRQEIQAMIDDVYKVFVSDVAKSRGKSYQFTDEYMAQGRVMLSESAKTVGLIDEIMSFDQALITISKKTLDKRNLSFENNNNLGATMSKTKKTLVGAVYNDLVAASQTPNIDATAEVNIGNTNMPTAEHVAACVEAEKLPVQGLEAQAQPEPEAQAPESTVVALEDGTVINVAEQVEASEVVEAPQDTAVQAMFAQLEAKDAQILEAKLELAKVQEKLASFEAMEGTLKGIVTKATQGMQIALGQARTDYSNADLKTVIEAHTAVSTTFTQSFKAGQQSINTAEVKEEHQQKSFKDLTAMARANATSL